MVGIKDEKLTYSSSSNSDAEATTEICYLVNFVDHAKKGQCKVHKLHVSELHHVLCHIMVESLAEHMSEGDEYDIGYIEPSKQGVHG